MSLEFDIPQRTTPLEFGQGRDIVISHERHGLGDCVRVQGEFVSGDREQRKALHHRLSELLLNIQDEQPWKFGEGRSYVYPFTETTSLLVLRARAYPNP